MKKTIIDLFESSVEKYGKKTFLLEKRHHAFQPTTYAETKEQALEVGAGLASLGIRPKDKVAILAEGSNGWIISELGIFYAGAISVPLSVKLEESNDLLFRLRHAEVKALFVSKQQLPKIRRIRAELPELEQIIVLGHIPLESGETAYGMLKRLGRDYLAGHKEEFLKIGQAIRNDDYATITYTSGTTADPKGVVLTHRNYTANVEQSLSRIDIPSSYRTLIILPLDHCFAHVVGFYIMIACGASVATVQIGATPMETLKNIPQNIRVKQNRQAFKRLRAFRNHAGHHQTAQRLILLLIFCIQIPERVVTVFFFIFIPVLVGIHQVDKFAQIKSKCFQFIIPLVLLPCKYFSEHLACQPCHKINIRLFFRLISCQFLHILLNGISLPRIIYFDPLIIFLKH